MKNIDSVSVNKQISIIIVILTTKLTIHKNPRRFYDITGLVFMLNLIEILGYYYLSKCKIFSKVDNI